MKYQTAFPKQALVLAAGLGTRLKPLTNHLPKPALPVGGVPILFFNLWLLKQAGVRNIVINLFHHPKPIKDLLKFSGQLGISIKFSMERKILGTAGGIAQAFSKLDSDTTFVLNGDILLDLDLKQFWKQHSRTKSLATLACVAPNRAKVRNFVEYDRAGKIIRIAGAPKFKPPPPKLQKGIFTGAHLVEPSLFSEYPRGQYGCIVRQIYQPALARGERLHCYFHKKAWWDLGSLNELKKVDQLLWQRKAPEDILAFWQEVYTWTEGLFDDS